MNVFIAEKVIGAVKQLLDGDIPDIAQGICGNVRMLCGETHHYNVTHLLHYVAKEWPKFSGVTCYPVPSPSGSSPSTEYHFTTNEWVVGSLYTALRIELCHFVIDYLKRYYNLK